MENGIPFKTKEAYLAQAKPEPQPAPAKEKEKEKEPSEPSPPKKAPEPPAEAGLMFSAADFKELISTVIAEARKPVRDERALARLKRMRDHNRSMQKDNRAMLFARFQNCNHMQLPGSVMTGCSCIAWATQSDQKKRGVCQHCGTIFSSERKECLNDEIYDSYKMLVRLPTHPAGNFNVIFQGQ
jgi:hypothetical protein